MAEANNKRIAKNTLMLYFRMILLMCISLYTSRVILEKLGISDFGLYNVVGGIISMLSFLNGAMATTNQRFLSFELGHGDSGRLQLVFSQSMIVHICIAIVFFILAETVGLWFVVNKLVIPQGSETAAMWVYQTMVLQFFLSVYTVPYNAAIVAHEKMNIYAMVGIVEAVLKLGVALLIGIFDKNRLIWFSIIMLLSSAITAGCYVTYGRIKFHECRLKWQFDLKVLKSLVSFAGWSIFGSIAWIAKTQGINIVLNMFFGTVVNAAFGVANQVNAAVSKFVQNFSTAMNPQIVKTYASSDIKTFNSVVERGSRWAFLLLFVLAFPVIICIREVLNIWLVEVPPYAAVFSCLIVSVSLLESFTYPIGTAIQATGKIKWYQIVVGVTLFMNVPASWLWLKAGGDAAVVLIAANIIAAIALVERLIIMRKIIPGFAVGRFVRTVFLQALIVAVVAIGLYAGVNVLISIDNQSLWIKLPVTACIGATTVWIIGLTRSEKTGIITTFKRKFNK